MKKFIFGLFLIALLGGGTYLPLNYHLLWYQSKPHVVEKEYWTFKKTFINLDKNPELWCDALRSETLKEYLYQLDYTKAAKEQLSCGIKSSFKALKKKAVKGIKETIKETGKTIKQTADKTIKTIKKELTKAADKILK